VFDVLLGILFEITYEVCVSRLARAHFKGDAIYKGAISGFGCVNCAFLINCVTMYRVDKSFMLRMTLV
jgi:hypothetical protein